MTQQPIVVGGAYKESDDHVPNPTDMVKQFNTEGVGAHGKIEEVAPVFEVDKVKTAEEILAAADPDNDAVPASRLLLPNLTEDNTEARDEAVALAEARVAKGVVVGGPTPYEREAALEGDEGVEAAVSLDRENAAANSTGQRAAGQHEGTVSSDTGRDDTSLVGSKGTASASPSDSDSDSDDESGDKYDDMDYSELQAEVKSRNEGRDEDDQIKPEGRATDDYKSALRADDEKSA